jgi:phage-related protein (TIGR01555 family)
MSDNPTAELLDLMRTDAGEILSAIEGALGNQRTGMGTANSVFWGTSVGMVPLLREQELRALYRSNWLIRRIIDVPAEDMTKNSVEVVLSDDGDEEDATKAMTLYQDSNPVDSPFESEYTLDQARYDAIRWARLFGRAYIVVHVNGGEDPSKPLRRVKSFDGVTVLDRFQLSPAPGEYNRYNPEFYALGTFQEDIDSSRARKVPFGWGQRIHRSRVLPFDGNRIHPADVQLDGDAGHDSVIQNLYDIFVRHFTAREGLSEGLASYSLFVATINGLSNLLSTPNGETALRRYLQTLNQQKSVYRTVVRDGEAGSADFVERTFAGVGEVMGQIVNELTAATGLPHYKIWGHEANTNALSQGGTESRAYASQVNSWQKRDLAPNDRRLFKMLFQVATGDIPAFNLEYPTIYEPTPQELAELEAQQAATLKIYWEMGAILPAHAALIKATGQDIETVLDADEIRKQLERQKKELLKHEGIMQAEAVRKAIADRFEVLRRAEGITKDQLHHAIATGQDLQDFLKPLDPERLEFPAEEDPDGEGADPNVALEALFGGGDAGTVEEAPVEAPTEPEPAEVVQTDAIDLTPPQSVREAFQRAVRAYDEGTINPGDGLEPATVRESRSIARGEAVTEAKVRKAYRWFARNSRFASAPKDSAAWAAWQLWGGQAFKGWVNGKYRELESRQDADELRGDARKGTGKACGASYIARWKTCRSGPGGRPVTEIVGVSDRLRQMEGMDKFIAELGDSPAGAEIVASLRESQKKLNDEIEDLVQIANIEYGERQRQENPDNWKSLKKVAEESGVDSRQLLEWTKSLDDSDEDSPIFEAPNGKRWMLANEEYGFRQKFIDIPEHWNFGLGQWDLPDYDYKNFDTHLPEWIDSYKNLLRQQGRMDSAQRTDDATPAKRIIRWQGFEIGLQYFPFDKRHGKVLTAGYGHFRRTKGADGMAVDCYVGPNLDSSKVFEVTQLIDGQFDELKMVIGVDRMEDAIAIYLAAMPRERLGGIREITLDDLAQYRVNEETKADALPTAGATVSWQWGEGTAYGKVAEVFPRRVQRTIQGSKVVRRGTEDNPALLIEQEDGSTALKLASEVSVSVDELRLDKKVCVTGRPCGNSCIRRFTKTGKRTQCRAGIGGTKKKAADKVAKGGSESTGGGVKATTDKPKNTGISLDEATGSDYFRKEMAELKVMDQLASRGRETAKKRATELKKAIVAKVAEYVKAKRSSVTEDIQTHGMPRVQKMAPIEFDGMKLYDSPSNQAKTIYGFVLSGTWDTPEGQTLRNSTKNIYLAKDSNRQDTYWEQKYNIKNFRSAATGGDGNVVVYGGRPITASDFYHEAGHNLAKQRYGSTDPSPNSNFGRIAAGGNAPTKYGKSSPAEDFADSVRLYMGSTSARDNRINATVGTELRSADAQRYNVIKRIFEDPNYGG